MKLLFLLIVLPILTSQDEKPNGPEPLSGSGPKYYKMLDDISLSDIVNHDGNGTYLNLLRTDTPKKDTVRAYVQGVVKNKVPPDYEAASDADVVIWCYPDSYHHPNHVLPGANGRIVIIPLSGKRFAVMDIDKARHLLSLSSDKDWNKVGFSP